MSLRASAIAALVAVAGCASDPPKFIPGGGPVCVSGRYWAQGDHGDNFMHPGRACIQCHTGRHRGPLFTVAGTIFTASHEEDECFGTTGGTRTGLRTQVEVTDSVGRPFIIEPNPSGNFYTTHSFQLPLRSVRVISPLGVVSEMFRPPLGDCNSCHTREGLTFNTPDGGVETVPGRIITPTE